MKAKQSYPNPNFVSQLLAHSGIVVCCGLLETGGHIVFSLLLIFCLIGGLGRFIQPDM